MDRRDRQVRVIRLRDEGEEPDVQRMSRSERVAMMWPLACDACAAKGEPVESRLPRHVVRVRHFNDGGNEDF